MRVIVFGLGSMGKRRIRNLLALGVETIGGYDVRADRGAEAVDRYGIQMHETEGEIWEGGYDAVVISLPPDQHVAVAREAIRRGMAFFTEASVLDAGMAEMIEELERGGVVGMPSCTMRYFPGPRTIRRVVSSGRLGRSLFWQYHSGQYLPDWHPWEPITDYYVSRRETGGCREIVPFELTWLTEVFGDVQEIVGRHARLGDLPADIDDIYLADLIHAGGTSGRLTVDVLARPAVRDFRLIGTEGSLVWDGVANTLRIAGSDGVWEEEALEAGTAEEGYINPEEPYIAEMRAFLDAAFLHAPLPNTFWDDLRVLHILYALEESYLRGHAVAVE